MSLDLSTCSLKKGKEFFLSQEVLYPVVKNALDLVKGQFDTSFNKISPDFLTVQLEINEVCLRKEGNIRLEVNSEALKVDPLHFFCFAVSLESITYPFSSISVLRTNLVPYTSSLKIVF